MIDSRSSVAAGHSSSVRVALQCPLLPPRWELVHLYLEPERDSVEGRTVCGSQLTSLKACSRFDPVTEIVMSI